MRNVEDDRSGGRTMRDGRMGTAEQAVLEAVAAHRGRLVIGDTFGGGDPYASTGGANLQVRLVMPRPDDSRYRGRERTQQQRERCDQSHPTTMSADRIHGSGA